MLTLLLAAFLAFDAKDATDTALVEALEEVDEDVRIDALKEMGRRGLVDHEALIVEVAKSDPMPKVRRAAMASLEDMAAEGTLEACEHMLAHDLEERNRAKCMAWLERKGPDSGSAAMVHAAANDPSPKLRRKAIIIIGKRGWLAGSDTVMAATSDPDGAIALEAWKAIIRLGDLDQRAQAHELMLDANRDQKLRRAVVKTIGENPLPQDVVPLMKALDDPDDEIAILAARALAKTGDSPAAAVLREKAASKPDGKVKDEFGEAAAALGG